MKLYIKIENNKAVNHPLMESNLRMLHPYLNLESKADLANYGYAIFERTPEPTSTYKKTAASEYIRESDIIKEKWSIIELSEEEKIAKQNEQHTYWQSVSGYSRFPSWVFNPTKCVYEPPLPKPLDNKLYAWNENVVNWTELDSSKIPILSGIPPEAYANISITIPLSASNEGCGSPQCI